MADTAKPHPGDLITYAFEIMNARGTDYDNAGSIEDNFAEMAAVASIVTGKDLTARDVAMVMHCVKLVRSKSAPNKIDTYVDGINYLAFAGFLTGLPGFPHPTRRAIVPKPAASGNGALSPVLNP